MGLLEKVNKKTEEKTGDIHIRKASGKFSEKFFPEMLDAVPLPVTYITPEHSYQYVNKAYAEWFGKEPDEIIGRTVKDFLGAKAYAAIRPFMERALKGETVHYEDEIVFKQQGKRFIDAVYTPDVDEQGSVRGYVALIKDITEKKQVEKALEKNQRESERGYRNLIQSLAAAIYTTDANGIITMYNPAAAELWGRKPEIGKDMWCGSFKIFEPDGITEVPLDKCPMAICLKEKRKVVVNDAYIVETPTGERKYFIPHPEPIIDMDGNMTGAVNMLVDVTESKLAEMEKAKLAAIVQSSDDAIVSKTLEGIVTSWNPGAEKLFGYKAEEMIGQPITKIIPKDRLEEEPRILERLKKGESVDHFETKRITKDGRILDISLTISPVRNSKGRVVGASKIARNITGQKSLADALQKSEERLRLAAESTMLGIWEYDLETKDLIWSDECKKIYGLPDDAPLNSEIVFSLNHPDDQELIDQELKAQREADSDGHTDLIYRIFRYDDKSIRWVRSKGKVLFHNGKPQKFIGTIQDVTDDKLAEENWATLAAIVQSTDDAIISKDLSGKITSWNTAAEKLYGYKADEIIGKHISELIPKDRLNEEDEILARIRSGVSVDHYETKRLTKDGKLIDVSLTVSPVRDSKGKVIGASKIARDITTQKTLMVELRENEERLRMAIETTRLGTWEYYPLTKDLTCSRECKRIFGVPEDFEPDNQFVYDHTYPADREMVKEQIRKAIAPGGTGSCEMEYRIVRKDGELRWVKAQGKTFFNSQDQPARFFGTMADITDEKLHEQELRDSVEMFQTMADNVPAMIWMSGDDKFEDYFNKTWLNFRGKTLEEESDEGWLEGVHPDDVQQCMNTYNESFKKQKGFYTEYRLRRHDGEYRWISDNSVPRFSPAGEFLGFISACMDIDDQKRYREKIQDSELLFKTISNASPAALWMTDADEQNVFVSDTWLKWTGKTFEEVIDRGWVQSLIDADREQTTKSFLESFKKRKYFHSEFRFLRKDGEIRWGLTEGYPFYDTNGTFAGYAGSVTDITDIKKLEQRKDDFIKMASHELKTPITSINGYVQLLMNIYNEMDDKKLQLTKATVKSSLHTISKQVSKLTRLISELLDLSRIESGKLELNKTDFDLADLVEETVRDVRLTTSKHAIVVNNEFTGKIFGDKDRIAQVIMNLLTNAIKYSPDASQVDVFVESDNNNAVIQVKDHGIGIDKKFHQKIFERFYRVEGKSEQTYPGFGIGLFIASEIVHRHLGTISVESEKGKGSVFTVTIPLTKK